MNNLNFEKDSLTKEGREKIVKDLSFLGINSYLRDRDVESWSMFNNTSDTDEFNFLTEVGEFSLPSKIRRIPIQRTKANILLSQQSLRTAKYGLRTIDSQGIVKKLTTMYKALMMMFSTINNQKYRTIEFQLQQIDQQVQQMQQMASNEPESSEEAQQQAEIREVLPQIIYQTSMVKDNLAQSLAMTKDEREKYLRKFEDSYSDLYEVYAHKLLVKLREEMDTGAVSLRNFRNKIVNGREYYYVNYNARTGELEYESIAPERLSFPNIENIDWTFNLPWIVIEDFMSKEQIRKNFNLTANELKSLEAITITDSANRGAFVTGPGKAVVLDNNAPDKKKYSNTWAGISVKRVYWRADHKIVAKQSPNKHEEGSFFTQFLEPDKDLIDTKDNDYSKKEGIYTDKNTGIKKKASEVNTYNSTKGERKQIRFFDKRYFGVNIGNGTIVKSMEDPVQPHPQDNLGYTPLPIVGKTFNGIGDYPYSIIWATTELQKQYWIVSYHRELTFALAGASGVVFDLSQKPDGMTKEEWFYHMKLGRYLIQTISKTGKRVNTGFNQFTKVDQTLTSSIQYFEMILQGLEAQIGTLMGVPRQRQGEVEASDQVGTFNQSNRQAALVTEILFKEHDEIESKALEQLLNLAIQYRYEPGEIVDVSEEEAQLIKIPYDFNERKFRMKLINSAKQDIDLEDMKRFSMQAATNGALPFEFMFKLFNVDGLKEMEELVEKQTARQQEIAELSNQNTIEAQAAAEQQKIKMQQDFEASMKGMEMKLKDATLKLEQYLGTRKLDIEEAKVNADAGAKQSDAQSKMMKDNVDVQLEAAKVNETIRSNKTNEKLKEVELQLEALLKSTGVSRGLGISGSSNR